MDRLVDVTRTTDGSGFDTTSYPTYADLRARQTVFESLYAVRMEPQPLSLGGTDGAERIYGEQVSASYFDALGIQPAVGNVFHTDQEQVGVSLRTTVLSHAFWQSRFGGRAEVVGQPIVLNGESFTVAGVGPKGFRGTTVMAPDVWVPFTANIRGLTGEETMRSRESNWLTMTARLKPGVSIAQAQAFLNTFSDDLRREYPEIYARRGLAATPASRLPGIGSQFIAPFLAVLMGITGLVLLVACTNLAGLLLARAATRSREVAVRLALGASRATLIRMLMSEALVLSILGSAAALLLASWITGAMAAALTAVPIPLALDLTLDWRVLAFTGAVAIVTTCVSGLAPALQSSRADLVPDLKSDASAPRRQRLRHIFITAQLAFCLVLIVTAGLFVRALGAATNVSPGFDVAPIEVAALDLALGGYQENQSAEVAAAVRDRFAAIPGIETVGMARMVPLDGGGLGLGRLRRRGAVGDESSIRTDWNVVSPEYFGALGLPIIGGRNFTATDRDGAMRVAIVNEHFARMVWPGESAIGQVLENGDFRPGRDGDIRLLTVVGIAKDAKYRWIGEAPAPFIYVPIAQEPMRDVKYFLRRTAGNTMSVAPAVRSALKTYNPNLPLVGMQSLQSYADLGLLPQRLAASIAGSLGIVALLLAAIGVYGVTAFAVASRTREIGVRIALGADRARVMRMVLLQGVRLAAIGGAIGFALALGASQLISSLLFGVSPMDPLTYGATLAALGAVTLAATFVPARRAATLDPLVALKAE